MPDTVVMAAPISDVMAPPEQIAAPISGVVAEAAIEIARVEADRDITVAEVHAATEVAVQAAMTERAQLTEEEEVEWLREELADLQRQCETNAAVSSDLRATLLVMQEQHRMMLTQLAEITAVLTEQSNSLLANYPPATPSEPEIPPPASEEEAVQEEAPVEPTRQEPPPANGKRKRVLFG